MLHTYFAVSQRVCNVVQQERDCLPIRQMTQIGDISSVDFDRPVQASYAMSIQPQADRNRTIAVAPPSP